MATWIVNLFEKKSATEKDTYLIPYSMIADTPTIPDVSGKANLDGGNTFTGKQTLTSPPTDGYSIDASGYVKGSWLQAPSTGKASSNTGKVCVLDGSGWVYYRTPAEIVSDGGGAKASDIPDTSKHGYTELTNENLNNITDVGWYRAAHGNSCTFAPEFLQMNKYAFILIVEKIADGTYVRQTVYGMENYNAATYGKYVRTIRTTSTGTTASFWEAQYTVTKNSQTFQGRKSFIDGINIKNSLQVEGSNGTSGQVLTSQGEGKTPIWADVSGGSSDNSKHGYTELTNENLNTITEVGWYRAESGNTCANKPTAFTSFPFILEVEKSTDVYIKQTTYTTKNSSDAFFTTYVRFSIDSGNTWTSWEKNQTMSGGKQQTFSGLKTFSGGINVFYSPLRFNSDAGSGGKVAMSQGATTSPKWVNLQVRVNGTTYTADSDGLIDLGEIGGGGSGASTSQYNDIY